MNKLKDILQRIAGRGYKAYQDIRGTFRFEQYLLHIDHVQADPFASPSRIRVEVPSSILKFDAEWYQCKERKIAFKDFVAREVSTQIRAMNAKHFHSGTGKSGMITIDAPGQEIIDRASVAIDQLKLELRLSIGLPAHGRKINGQAAQVMFFETIPALIQRALLSFDRESLLEQLELVDQQMAIREYITQHGYTCFIANGSILPRRSGNSNLPLQGKEVIPFQSPPSLEVELKLPHNKIMKGMAIPSGITLIVGGGFHGKSTLLKGIERGVYNHVKGDGREYVITDASSFKIRAEDGRPVEKVNISPFINNLPFGKDTVRFSTDDASGSTSQAANIMEALEIGSKLLLIDEDTSATNFMIRDTRMQELVGKEKEPITPFIDKVRQLYEAYKISTILVLGGSGDYFDVADLVIMMDEYQPFDMTKQAKKIASNIQNERQPEGGKTFGDITNRAIIPNSFNASKGKREKVVSKGLSKIIYGKSEIDLSFVEQLVDTSQTNAIALMMQSIAKAADGNKSLSMLINQLYEAIDRAGLEVVSPYQGQHPGEIALPRKLELAAAINRLRGLRVR